MAKVTPPKRGTKGRPPSLSGLTSNLNAREPSELVPLNFKVQPSLHMAFKTYAVRSGISMKELLERCFMDYVANNPID